MYERLNRFDLALSEKRRALAGWDADYGSTYVLYEAHPRAQTDDVVPVAPAVIREELADETSRLVESLSRADGALVERGRWLVGQGSFREALVPLAQVLNGSSSSDVTSDARYWQHRARVGIALQLAAADNPARNVAEALNEVQTVAQDHYDFSMFFADIAKACILWQQGSSAEADVAMQTASERWQIGQRSAREEAQTEIGKDIAAIRELVFHPEGSSTLGAFSLNALRPRRNAPTLVIVNPEVHVRFADGTVGRPLVYQQFSSAEHALFLTVEQRAALGTIVAILDGRQNQRGTNTRAPAGQPVEQRPQRVRPFWDRFFPTGEWQHTPGETGPSIRDIEFLDAERTKAAARIVAASQGTTVMLQRLNGAWRVVDLVDGWIS
jgi:hypothetical protein